MRLVLLLSTVLLGAAAVSPARAAVTPSGEAAALAHTYSIVARDSATGEPGVAVQSHYFSVGPIVPWAEAGVGAIATQSLVLVDYGPNGLGLLRRGLTARAALDSLLRADAHNEGRQVAIVDAHGNVATYTGSACIPDAGHAAGAQFSCQANLMANERVWPAMKAAFERAKGDLAERMLQALEAAEVAGGDIRGRQSAAIVVVRAQSTGKPWADRVVDLRVEDADRPLVELRRLVRLRRAYNLEDQGDTYMSEKQLPEAARAYEAAMKLAPDVVELRFWAAVSMVTSGDRAQGMAIFREVFAGEARWVPLVPRLVKAGLFPNDAALLGEVAKQATRGAPW